jgi:osmotically-inducible protein OsmY
MSIRNIRVLLFVACTCVLFACESADKKTDDYRSTSPTAPDTTAGNNKTAPPTAPDNTGVNQRDSSGTTVTPPDQSESASDLAITSKIRQEIVNDKSLSTNAHNVKVVTNTGVVTLRGPVKDAQERSTIEAKARQVAGVTRIDNQIEIETSK